MAWRLNIIELFKKIMKKLSIDCYDRFLRLSHESDENRSSGKEV